MGNELVTSDWHCGATDRRSSAAGCSAPETPAVRGRKRDECASSRGIDRARGRAAVWWRRPCCRPSLSARRASAAGRERGEESGLGGCGPEADTEPGSLCSGSVQGRPAGRLLRRPVCGPCRQTGTPAWGRDGPPPAEKEDDPLQAARISHRADAFRGSAVVQGIRAVSTRTRHVSWSTSPPSRVSRKHVPPMVLCASTYRRPSSAKTAWSAMSEARRCERQW